MKALSSVRDVFARSSLANIVSEAFRPKPHGATKLRERKPHKRLDFSMEALEPRLLLSANVNYPAVPSSVTDLTLQIVNDSGLKVKLLETANLSNAVFSSSISANEDTINIGRALTPGLFQDTVRIDLSTFDLLNPAGDALTINFAGGAQDAWSDQVILSGSATLGYGLTVASNADIAVSGSLTLSDADDDITLQVAMTDNGLPTPLTTNDFYANATADIDVNGVLSAHDVNLTATSTVTLDNTVFGTDLPGSRDAALLDSAKATDDIARAIAQGDSLDDLLEETAATLGGGGADDGRPEAARAPRDGCAAGR